VVPPVAERVAVYAVPTVPVGRDVVEILRLCGFGLGAALRAETFTKTQIKAAANQTPVKRRPETFLPLSDAKATKHITDLPKPAYEIRLNEGV